MLSAKKKKKKERYSCPKSPQKKREEKLFLKLRKTTYPILRIYRLLTAPKRVFSSPNILPFSLRQMTCYYVLSTVISPLYTLSSLILQQALEGGTIIIIISTLRIRKYCINNIQARFRNFKIISFILQSQRITQLAFKQVRVQKLASTPSPKQL